MAIRELTGEPAKIHRPHNVQRSSPLPETALAPRAAALLSRLDSWAEKGTVRALLLKVGVTVVGPLVILAGVAMLVLPGPGLLTIAAGFALLALEYPWARHVVAVMGHKLAQARAAVLPKDGSPGRRAFGGVLVASVAVAGFLGTTAATAFVGAHTFL
jgi:uncharacterized protein (TIGR02611 family)